MIEESGLNNAESLIRSGTKKLSSISNVPRLEAEVLLSFLLDIKRIKFHTDDIDIDSKVMNKFKTMIESRFRGMPLAYLTGQKEFWSMNFFINQSVLVPRPETELLIENAIEIFKNHESPNILELGTGSGIISIVLQKELSNPDITAIDISEEALKIAKMNAEKHEISDIRFVVSDWFSEIMNEKFDLIISNPPYVDRSKLSNEELFGIDMEPEIALYSENDGTSDLEFIIKKSPDYLKDGGWLILEHGYDQSSFCVSEMKTAGYSRINNSKDIQNITRTTFGMLADE
ncbi:MAG: peptide chain release factor N(5)-glutamine methyltransferase [Gammaproteobacteria bacterium]